MVMFVFDVALWCSVCCVVYACAIMCRVYVNCEGIGYGVLYDTSGMLLGMMCSAYVYCECVLFGMTWCVLRNVVCRMFVLCCILYVACGAPCMGFVYAVHWAMGGGCVF